MEKFTVAFATDDGKHFMDRHFGDANYYYIYEISSDSKKFIKKITNTTEEEKTHADPNKAKSITQILQQEGVNIAVSKIFGPNLKRIKKKFVCVITNESNKIDEVIPYIQINLNHIKTEWNKGEQRNFLKI